MDYWRRLVPKARVILDVGANSGIYSLVAQALNPSAEVHAFEPLPKVFETLKHNVSLNSFPTHLHPVALSDYSGEATVYLPAGQQFAVSVTVNENLAAPGVPVDALQIAVDRLDAVVARLGIERIDLMKIDVETHEPQVLRGMGHLLAHHRPQLLVELLNDAVAGEVNSLLQPLGYLFYDIDERNPPMRVDSLRKSSFYNFLALQPEAAERLGLG